MQGDRMGRLCGYDTNTSEMSEVHTLLYQRVVPMAHVDLRFGRHNVTHIQATKPYVSSSAKRQV